MAGPLPEWPVFGLVEDVRQALAQARAEGRPSVLATLFAVEGAAPRGVGAQMMFTESGATGFLAGGCIEADVALAAEQVLRTGAPRRLVYGRGGPADLMLPCGSRIDVLLERVGPNDPTVARLLDLGHQRRPALWLSDGEARACLGLGEAADLPRALELARRAASEGPAECGAFDTPFALYRRADPVRRLIVVGGEPVALATASLGIQAGWEVFLVRAKGPQTPPPLPLRYLAQEAVDAFAAIGLDPWTAVALLTHDTERDHQALLSALPSPAAYVGVLGSRRRLPERRARLLAGGLDQAHIDRLKAPIGLNIRARTAWEIAVSITGDIMQTWRERASTETWPAVEAEPA